MRVSDADRLRRRVGGRLAGAVVAAALLWAGAAGAQSVQVTGMVAHPGPVALATLKPVSVAASFHTMPRA